MEMGFAKDAAVQALKVSQMSMPIALGGMAHSHLLRYWPQACSGDENAALEALLGA